MLNFTPMTMLPPMLQGVAGYPDSVIGFIIGARGLGTLAGFAVMIYASRLDPRGMIALGFLLQALAGWQLAQLDPGFGVQDVFWPMAVQGLGVGLLWVPITMVAFSAIEGERLAEGTAVYHMLRNIGSSVHISLSTVLVVHMTQASHAELSPNVSRYNEALSLPWVSGAFDLADPRAWRRSRRRSRARRPCWATSARSGPSRPRRCWCCRSSCWCAGSASLPT